ncbi:MAG: hypothetical protein JWM02_2985 [Frankiales bacterium]|nr:hypothetical protein [Frankiales bacterium]
MRIDATKETHVIALGLVLLILGAVVSSLHVLFVIGLILLLVGLVVNFLPLGGTRRRVW